MANSYYDQTDNRFEFISSGTAGAYAIVGNTHQWNISTGTTGANNPTTFTQAMTLDADGDLGIGTTSPAAKLHIGGNNGIRFGDAGATPKADITYTSAGSEFLDIKIQGTTAGFGNIRFSTGGTPSEAARFPAAGGFQSKTTISVGDAAPSTSGAGITFPATQSASSDANTLDDYEEGTWTPTDNSGAGLTFTNNGSQYTKIGRAVTINFEISWPVTVDVNNVSVSLPINSSSSNRAGLSAFSNVAGEVNIYTPGGASFLLFGDTGTAITNAVMSGKYLIVSLTYFTA
jgi:hypothetical protein